jgi:hypothetical protein
LAAGSWCDAVPVVCEAPEVDEFTFPPDCSLSELLWLVVGAEYPPEPPEFEVVSPAAV